MSKPGECIEKTWQALKKEGSNHYKSGLVEPVDLFLAGGIFQPFAIGCIIKYAFRQRKALSVSDCDKIIHYAEMLKCLAINKQKEGDAL